MAFTRDNFKFFIISDSDETVENLSGRLQGLGYDVAGGSLSLAKGMRRAENVRPSMILVDQTFHENGQCYGFFAEFSVVVAPLVIFIPAGRAVSPEPCPFIRVEIPDGDRDLEVVIEAARYSVEAEKGRRLIKAPRIAQPLLEDPLYSKNAPPSVETGLESPGYIDPSEFFDFKAFQTALNDFYELFGIGLGVVDLNGKVLASAGIQDICLDFHRVNPDAAAKCQKHLAVASRAGQREPGIVKCGNNMWDIIAPIHINGRYMANLFLGQFFFEDEPPDYELFRAQAEKYGFDETEYLAALDRVPRWSREALNTCLRFFRGIVEMLTNLGHGAASLSQAVEEKERLLDSLRGSEELFRSITEQVTEAIYITDDQGVIGFISPAAEKIFGFKPDEMIGRPFWDFLDEADFEKAFTEFAGSMAAGGQVENLLLGMKNKKGEIFAGELNGNRYVKNGQVAGTLGVIRDVSARKAIEEDLIKSGQRLRQAQKLARLGYWTWEASSDALIWSEETYAIFGRDPAIYKPSREGCVELVHPDDRDILENGWWLRESPDDDLKVEHRILLPDGSIKYVEETAEVVRNKEGLLVNVLGCIQDITRRKTAELVLMESEIRYRTLVESAADAIFIADADSGEIVEANHKAVELIGRPADELVGTRQWELHHASDQERYRNGFREHAGNGATYCLEAEVLNKNGELIPVEISTSTFELSGRKLAIGLFRDISARKKSEMLLKESRKEVEFLADLLERGAQPFAVALKNGRLTMVNAAYSRLTGYDKDELYQLASVLDLTPPEWLDVEREQIRFLKATGKPVRFEKEYIRKDGSRVPVEVFANLAPDDGWRAGEVFAFINDISVRKKAEAALMESERKFRILADQSLLSICIIQRDGFKYVNRAYMDLTGYEYDEIMAMSVEDTARFVHPDYRDFVMEQGRLKMAGAAEEIIPQYVYKGVRKNGEERWVEQYSKTVDWQGEPANMMTLVDVTEREEAKRQLMVQQQTLKTILDGIPDVVSLQRPDRTIISYNQAGYDSLDKPPEEVIGRKCYELINQTVPCDGCTTAQAAGSGRIESREFYSEFFDAWYHTRAIPIFDQDGRVSMVLELLQDITERKKAEEEKMHLKSQLHQAQKMEAIGTLAGGVAHDFNNLLQAMNGYTQILLFDKKKTEPGYKELLEIKKAGDRAAKLVQQLLAFSRKIDSERKPISLNFEVEQAVRLLERTIPKMVRIETVLDQNLKAINADPVQVEQILLNLGVNASDAMSDGGTMTIKTENKLLDDEFCREYVGIEPGKYVLLTVSDTGAGIDPETLEHIFEPFYTTKEFGKGTGMGLSSVYGIVKSHGGYINCSSKVGEGAAFELYFPAIQLLEQVEPEEPEEEQCVGGSETILIVDDEESVRNFTAKALRKYGFTSFTAANGEEAVSFFSENVDKPDLVVLDIGMPGMGGQKCLEEIMQLKPDARVVIASGYPVEGRVQEMLNAGAADFIGKPYPMTKLVKTIRNTIDQK